MSKIRINRGAIVCGAIALLTLIYLIANGAYLFFNVELVQHKVEKVKLVEIDKKSRLTLKLVDNPNIYYQIYQDRFQEPESHKISEGSSISFYTTPNKFTIDKPILASKDFNQFDYFPIFNVNTTKNIFHFISYYLFGGSWMTIIFYLFSAGTFFYMVPYVAATSLPRRLFSLAIAGIYVWVFLLE